MITKKNLLYGLLTGLFCLMSGSAITQEVDKMPDTRVYYSVFVQSFYDSNGDGIGDLPGLTSRLDYLSDLGIKGLWLLPVHPSPSYHKYDVSDYYAIHPDYGTLGDYRSFVKEAHNRGMIVLLDLVINHTSNRIDWFRNASESPRSPYRDYYIWSDKQADFDAEPFHWHPVRDSNGKQTNGPRYYGFFWWEMPDLNFDNRKVREEILKIASFWLQDVGVDGFRMDAAQYIYPEDQKDKTLAWWTEFGKEVRKMKEDAIIIGEVWGSSSDIAPYLSDRMTACFNLQLADTIRISLQEEKDHGILQTWRKIHENYEENNPGYQDAILLSNHDMNRIMTELGRNNDKAKLAASLLLTLPGNPFIYYGEEIGMLGEKPDEYIREPFLWNIAGEDQGQTRWEIPYASTPEIVKPLAFQTDDPKSIYNHYKTLIRIRNNSPALSNGMLKPLVLDNKKVIGFIRVYQAEVIMVLLNLTGQMQQITAPHGISGYNLLFGSHPVFKSGGNIVYLQPWSTFILKQKTP